MALATMPVAGDALLLDKDPAAAAAEADREDEALRRLVWDFAPRTRRKLRRFGERVWRVLTDYIVLYSVFNFWSISHQNFLIHANVGESDLASCTAYSWSTTVVCLTFLVLQIVMYTWRELSTAPIPVAVEQGIDVSQIAAGIFLASVSGTTQWDGRSAVTDLCSNVRAPPSHAIQMFADTAGISGLLRSVLVVIGRPYRCGKDATLGIAASCALVVAVAVLIQVTLLDLVLVPLLARAVRGAEEGSDTLSWLDDFFGLNVTSSV